MDRFHAPNSDRFWQFILTLKLSGCTLLTKRGNLKFPIRLLAKHFPANPVGNSRLLRCGLRKYLHALSGPLIDWPAIQTTVDFDPFEMNPPVVMARGGAAAPIESDPEEQRCR